MKIIREDVSASLANASLAFDAVRKALIAVADGTAVVNPVVLEPGPRKGTEFGVKSGQIAGAGLIGAKIGTYWPGNERLGLPAHLSTVFLLNEHSGKIEFAVEATELNGWRTAAADAVAATVLARPDSHTVSLIGAGNQARFEARALCELLDVREVLVASRSSTRANQCAAAIGSECRVRTRVTTTDEACRRADILVTVTPSRAPLFDGALIRPGTHIAAMGADAPGKQEIPLSLMRSASLFVDCPMQSRRIGEMQHIRADIDAGSVTVTAIGDVLRGVAPGRKSDEEITVFDSSGVAIQDLLVARRIVELMQENADEPE